MPWTDEIDRRLQFGPGMRVQRLVEAALLLVALFSRDVRFAYPALVLTVLQAGSGRLALVAILVAAFKPAQGRRKLSDLYFDVDGSRGACVVAAMAQAVGIGLIHAGFVTAGFLLLTLPTASFMMSPTLGFCAGCWLYVMGRDVLSRIGLMRGGVAGAHDVEVADER